MNEVVDKGRLLGIKELNIAAETEEELKALIMDLFFFCDTLPSHEASIIAALEAKDPELLIAFLENLRGFLTSISAESFANTCDSHAERLRQSILNSSEIDNKKLRSEMESFIASLHTLSVDILLAGYIVTNAEEGADSPLVPQQEQEPKAPEEISILAVDDAKFYLHALKLRFLDTPYKFTGVSSGVEAIHLMAEPGAKVPDMFLIDTDMPEMDGYTLAKALRSAGLKSPIIFLAGAASRETVIEALGAGGCDIIIKACDKEQFLKKVRRYI